MATTKQIEANRRNSQSSTGPRTAAGKAAVRFNALRSGIDAESQLIPGENPEAFATFAAEFTKSHNPADASEQELVDHLIDDAWRLRRLRKAETQLWTSTMERHQTNSDYREGAELARAFGSLDETLTRLQRQVASIKRSYHQTSADLIRLQSARKKAEEQTQFEQASEASQQNPNPQPPPPTPVLPPPAPVSPALGHCLPVPLIRELNSTAPPPSEI